MKWEYYVIRWFVATEENLNKLGQKGWELAGIDADHNWIFKRPK